MRKKREPQLSASGLTVIMPYKTSYWLDGRFKEPDKITKGFPASEDGSIVGLHWVHRGIAFKVQCTDRIREKVLWTVKRGARIPGTHLYQTIIEKGDAE